MKRYFYLALAALGLIIALFAGLEFRHLPVEKEKNSPGLPQAERVVRGQYLAKAGNCMACHTVQGGQEGQGGNGMYAGGRGITTPFGTIYSSNITPDLKTGIGSWTEDDFWRAIHYGKSKEGHFLYPAFPYPNYTRTTRQDSDALYAYLKTVPAVSRLNQEHELQFPFNYRFLLAFWRALYFRPGVYEPVPAQTAQWNRGAYLVQGLGHCSACHTSYNRLGAMNTQSDLAGGLIPMLDWYAPSLTSSAESGLSDWETQHIVELLKTGISPRGAVFGPMSEVVYESLQHLSDHDVSAMAVYLKSLSQKHSDTAQEKSEEWRSPRVPEGDREKVLLLGRQVYQKHCIECHKASGEGIPPHYPALAGNRAITAVSAVNAIRMVLNGGYPPGTAGNPRPYGMPPFRQTLNNEEVAAVVSYILGAWGNHAEPVSAAEVDRYRAVPE